ncbi:hypothetical protein [Ferruginibacter sp.]
MPSISKTAHYKFAAATKNFLIQEHPPEAAALLQQQFSQLELIFQKYNDRIAELYAMINDYEKTQKSIRLNIKKMTKETERILLK